MSSYVQYHHLNGLTQIRHFKVSETTYWFHIFGESIRFREADTLPSSTGKAIEEVVEGKQVPYIDKNGKMYSIKTNKLYM